MRFVACSTQTNHQRFISQYLVIFICLSLSLNSNLHRWKSCWPNQHVDKPILLYLLYEVLYVKMYLPTNVWTYIFCYSFLLINYNDFYGFFFSNIYFFLVTDALTISNSNWNYSAKYVDIIFFIKSKFLFHANSVVVCFFTITVYDWTGNLLKY